MILLHALLLGATLSAGSECKPPPPGPEDREGASLYAEIGDEERQRGARRTALAAYRQALASDPENRRALAGLELLCRPAPPARAVPRPDPGAEALGVGAARLEAGDAAGALAALEIARRHGVGSAAALLEGLAFYELGDYERAEARLVEARGDGELAQSADFYLGLIAYHQGARERAAALLAPIAQGASSPLSGPAAQMLALAAQGGRVALVVSGEGGHDANPYLVPHSQLPGGFPDQYVGVRASVRWRPNVGSGLYASATAHHRTHLRSDILDLTGGAATGGARTVGDHHLAALEYGYTYLLLQGRPYLGAHQAQIVGIWGLSGPSAGLRLWGRDDRLVPAELQDYSGRSGGGELDVGFRWASGANLRAGYSGARAVLGSAASSWLLHGPLLRLEAPLSDRVRLQLLARALWRGHDAFDPELGAQRVERGLEGGLALELRLADRLTAVVRLSVQTNASNVPVFTYNRWALGFTLTHASVVW